MTKKIISFFFLILLLNFTLIAQQKATIAVLPFSAMNVSEAEAQIMTNLFETSLVKTNVYSVIEQNDVEMIIEAQSYSLSSCTDDSCAIEVGALLSAELIVLGSYARLEDQYIANVKIIDVTLGQNIVAESVSSATVSDMTSNKIALLAYKLVGLTHEKDGIEQIATNFGDIHIATDPEGADVFINGIRRGTSPFVVEKIPFGEVSIRAVKDNRIAEKDIVINKSDLVEVNLELKLALGRLFLKNSERELTVYLDGKRLGRLGDGIFREQPAGMHVLSLVGDGKLWEEQIEIITGETLSLEIFTSPAGAFLLECPADISIQITGRNVKKVIDSNTTVPLFIGEYEAVFGGNDKYKKFELSFKIDEGEKNKIAVDLKYTDSYALQLSEQAAQEKLDKYRTRFERLEKGIQTDGVSDVFIADLKLLYSKIIQEDITSSDLLFKVKSFYETTLNDRILDLKTQLQRTKSRESTQKTIGISSLVLSGAAFLTSGIVYALGLAEYENYTSADTTPSVRTSRQTLELYSAISNGSLIAGGAGAVAGTTMIFLRGANQNRIADLEKDIDELSVELAVLQGGSHE